ncbi:S8 family peptidase [Aeoliella sp. SH292]|uniref:S8 family peptidase n=1 Tax=Aeoliella sp. SH292 TaxID=3454464 RepID=UPI003F9AE4E0
MPRNGHSAVRRSAIEPLESRQMMAADFVDAVLVPDESIPSIEQHGVAAADFWIDPQDGFQIDAGVEQHLNEAHAQTGLDHVRANYGFTGIGQTVVVIDSGIAYDHFALGGGFGTGYRVVGGWDFAENEWNPFDDGTEGSHGTHVAGIIGSTGDEYGNHTGVAPGVDLVGLRVFDDAGAGTFDDVARALQWVIDNHKSFENPITAVNLSLGTSWNSATAPGWASLLESKFQEIESLGIFIAVSAGNSFSTYKTPGLSYPAASQYVVPVMSVDDNGELSSFSQRLTNAIAAPGRYIRSTVPDYAGNHNGRTDDFASFSGTSMAAPYVAGASVLIRQAMELVGRTAISQDTIYSHMRQTADAVFDAATGTNYLRLNLEAAIDAILPDDDYGSTTTSAHHLGTLTDGETQTRGMISSLADIDYFTFTATADGVAKFSATATHDLDLAWKFGSQSVTRNGDTWTMNVVAGESYTLGIGTTDGLGYYTLAVSIESSFSFVDWNQIIGQHQFSAVNCSGETWYRIVAGQTGFVTAEAMATSSGTGIELALYDANMQMVGQGTATTTGARVEALATAGQEFFIRASGASNAIDFQLTNMVNLVGSTLTVTGTGGNNAFTFHAGDTHRLSVNGVEYAFDAKLVNQFIIDAGAGNDTVEFHGTLANEQATLRQNEARVVASDYHFQAIGAETVRITGGGGLDQVAFYGSSANEQYVGHANRAMFSGTTVRFDVLDYASYLVQSGGGLDKATFYDTAGDEWYIGRANKVQFSGAGFHHEAVNFSSTLAYSTGGNDSATLHGSQADDVYVAWADRAFMTGAGYHNDTRGFARTLAYASGGNDQVTFYDTAGDDTFAAWSDRAILAGEGYYHDARGFARARAYGTTGVDVAMFYDTTGDDGYLGRGNQGTMSGAGYRNDAFNFDSFTATASQGFDMATLYDSAGDDVSHAYHDRSKLWGDGFSHRVNSFDRTVTIASTGHDVATLRESPADDASVPQSERALMSALAYVNRARGFDRTVAQSTPGYDRASLYDWSADDEAFAQPFGDTISASNYRQEVRGSERVDAFRTFAGEDEATVDSIDNLFQLLGDWQSV